MAAIAGVWRWVPIAAVVAVGLIERAEHLRQWPIGFRLTLEFDSANAARTIYLWLTASHSGGWEQAWLAARVGRFIEPPIMQTLTALTYLPGGVERPWTAAVFATAFWFTAAAFLFVAVHRLSGWWGATIAAGFLLLAPFPAAASQSFQPEPVVVLGLAIVIWCASLGDVTAGRRFWLAVLAGAFAGLTKPGVLLPLIAAVYTAAMIRSPNFDWRSWRRWLRLFALMVMVALPAFLYAVVLIPGQVGDKILPEVLLGPNYYTGWWENVMRVVGIIPLVAGILGFVLVRRLRSLGIGLGVGYVAYSAVFTWHTMTHDYYHLPLVILVAVGIGGLGQHVVELTRGRPFVRSAAAVGLAVAVVGTFSLAPPNLLGLTPGRYPDAMRLAQIGEFVDPGQRVLAYTANYGKPLEYYAKLIVAAWPSEDDLAYLAVLQRPAEADEARLEQMMSDFNPHYFVITAPADVPRLVNLLDGKFKLVASRPSLRIYDLSSANRR